MSRTLSDLVPEFREKYEKLLIICQNNAFNFTPYYTVRTPQEQGALWRQSRSTEEINARIASLRKDGCEFLADCISSAGPRNGVWATNAIPGLSWHQWGEACDAFLKDRNGMAIWDAKHVGYTFYAEQAQALGMTPGLYFKNRKGWPTPDAVHIQLRKGGVENLFSIKEINDEMEKRFNK